MSSFRPSKKNSYRASMKEFVGQQKTMAFKILGYVSGIDDVETYIVASDFNNPDNVYLVKTREQNNEKVNETTKELLLLPQKMRAYKDHFKVGLQSLLEIHTNPKTKKVNEAKAKSEFSEKYLKMKTQAEPGAIILCKGCYIDKKYRPADLIDFADENLGKTFKRTFDGVVRMPDGSAEAKFGVEYVEDFINPDDLKTLPIVNVRSIKRITRAENGDDKSFKYGYIKLNPPIVKEVQGADGKNYAKTDIVLNFIDSTNAIEVKQGSQLKAVILEQLSKLAQEGIVNAGVIIRMEIAQEGDLNFVSSTQSYYAIPKQNEDKEWVIDPIETIADEIYQQFFNTYMPKPNEYGESAGGFTESDFLEYPNNAYLNTILKVEVVPIRLIKIPHFEQRGVNEYMAARAFFLSNNTTYDKEIWKNKFVKMQLAESDYLLPPDEETGSQQYGYVEGFISYKINKETNFPASLEEVATRYFAGSLENTPATYKKYSGDSRYICLSQDLVPTNVINDIVKESRPGEYKMARIYNATPQNEIAAIEANNKFHAAAKEVKIAEAPSEIISDDDYNDIQRSIDAIDD